MKKTLTKQDKINRKEKINKWCKRLLVVSFVINLFFIICSISGCVTNNKQKAENLDNNIARVMRNNAIDSSSSYHFVSYDLTHMRSDMAYRLGVGRHTIDMTYNVSIDNFLVIGMNGGPITDSSYNMHLLINGSVVEDNNNYSFIGTILFESPVTGSNFVTTYENDGVYADFSSFIQKVSFYDGGNYNDFSYYFPLLFDSASQYNFDLNVGWSPYAFITNSFTRSTSSTSPSTQIISGSAWVGVGSKIYNQLSIVWSGSGNRIYYPDKNTTDVLNNFEFIMMVNLTNTITHNQIILMTPQYITIDGNVCVVNNTLSFINTSDAYLTLIEGANNYSNLSNYNNYQIYSASFNGFQNGSTSGSGEFGDVFGLITTAFDGLRGLLSISILPNITLGILVFLPLMGAIIFAIIRIIKK